MAENTSQAKLATTKLAGDPEGIRTPGRFRAVHDTAPNPSIEGEQGNRTAVLRPDDLNQGTEQTAPQTHSHARIVNKGTLVNHLIVAHGTVYPKPSQLSRLRERDLIHMHALGHEPLTPAKADAIEALWCNRSTLRPTGPEERVQVPSAQGEMQEPSPSVASAPTVEPAAIAPATPPELRHAALARIDAALAADYPDSWARGEAIAEARREYETVVARTVR